MDNGELFELEKRINELKVLYDNYFAGIERREPLRHRDALVLYMRKIDSGGKSSTQLQFRFNNLRARFSTLEQHWNRIVKQIEEGTYRKKKPSTADVLADAPAIAKATPMAAPAPALPDGAMQTLYKSYSEARAKAGEPVMTYDAMVSSLKKQVPMVIEKYKCKSVDFKVGQKDGKTIIRAVPIS